MQNFIEQQNNLTNHNNVKKSCMLKLNGGGGEGLLGGFN